MALPVPDRVQSYASRVSIHLEMFSGDQPLGTGTGFLLHSLDERMFLVTNWHVLAGRNPDTGECLHAQAAVPDRVKIFHHSGESIEKREPRMEPLYGAEGGNSPRWLEHPRGQEVDVVLLPLADTAPPVAAQALRADLAKNQVLLLPGLPVAIVGFPFGIHVAERWPIWKTGHIASDPGFDYDGRPSFLIDVTTRPGMSGSPIFYQSHGPFDRRDGEQKVNALIELEFLGVYSGRIHEHSEIARGWRHQVVSEILDHHQIPPLW